MRLSEAIRLGSMMKPQAHGMAFTGRRTCVFAAAADAIGLLIGTKRRDSLPIGTAEAFPILALRVVPPFESTKRTWCVRAAGMALNDEHRWTRERIADWVETIERAQEQREALQALSLVGVGIDQ